MKNQKKFQHRSFLDYRKKLSEIFSYKKKSQTWGVDLLIASIIFVLGIIVFYLYIMNFYKTNTDVLKEIQADGEKVSDDLMSEGYPLNWDANNVVKIGLLSGDEINHTKLIEFYNLARTDYNLSKRIFGTKYDYYMFFDEQIEIDVPPICTDTCAAGEKRCTGNNVDGINWTSGSIDDDIGYGISTDPLGNIIVVGITGGGNANFVITKYTNAGSVIWNKVIDRSIRDVAYGVKTDSSGNIYVAGSVHQGSILDDIWTLKFDANGNEIWNRTSGGIYVDEGFGITLDSSNNVYVTGYSNKNTIDSDIILLKYSNNGDYLWNSTVGGSSIDMGGGVVTDSLNNIYINGITQSYGAGDYDIWLIKYNSNGDIIWNKTIGGTLSDKSHRIAIDSSNNLYIIGSTSSFGEGINNIWTIKLDSDGNQIWNRTFGKVGEGYNGEGIAVDSSQNILVGGTKSAAGMVDIIGIKYDSSGNLIWNYTIGGNNMEDSEDIAVDSSGISYIVGATKSFSAIGWDFYVAKLFGSLAQTCADYSSPPDGCAEWGGSVDCALQGKVCQDGVCVATCPSPSCTSGDKRCIDNGNANLVWDKTIGGTNSDEGRGVATDSSGNVYVTGSTASFGAGSYDVWIIKYDSNGNYIWNRTIGGFSLDRGFDIATDSSGNVYITGHTFSFNVGSDDVWTIKYDSNGNYIWNKTIGGINGDEGRGVATDSSGNVYVTGSTYSFGAGNNDVWTIKYDRNGNYIWNKTIGGINGDYGSGIATDSLGNVYVTGYTNSFGAGGYDFWTIKYDSNGNYIWNRTIGGINADYGSGIATDSSGNVYVTGSTYSFGAGSYDIWTIKYDINGNYIWNRTIGGINADYGYGITTDYFGNVYVTGQTSSYGAGDYDVWIIKYDSNGNYIWNWTIGGYLANSGKGIATDSSSNIYVTGHTNSFGAGSNDVWTIKLGQSFNTAQTCADYSSPPDSCTEWGGDVDCSAQGKVCQDGACVATCPSPSCTSGQKQCVGNGGNLVWDKTIGGTNADTGHEIATDSSGNVYVTGYTHSFGAGDTDVWTIKYDSNGNYIWNRTIGGTGIDRGEGVATDSSGNVYITGETYSFGAGDSDAWVIKYDSNGDYLWNKTFGGIGKESGQSIAIDFSNNIYIAGWKRGDILLIRYDSYGNEIWSRTIGGTGTDRGYGVATDSSGNVYITGETSSFGGGLSDVWTLKYDSNGNQLWNKTFGGANFETGYDITADSLGNVYVTGNVFNSAGSVSAGNYDILTLKYNTNGNLLWSKTNGGSDMDMGYGIEIDLSKNVYVTGYSDSYRSGNSHVWTIKYDTNGNLIWNKIIDDATVGNAMTRDSLGYLYITGRLEVGGYGSDIWTMKYNANGNIAQTCSDYNGDFCVEWGGNVDCSAQGKVCQSGQCVPASSSYIPSLAPLMLSGELRTLSSAGSSIPASASSVSDSTIKIDGIGLPGANRSNIINGTYPSNLLKMTRFVKYKGNLTNLYIYLWRNERSYPVSCMSLCTVGLTQCFGNTLKTCSDYSSPPDGCYEWGGSVDCALQGKVCQDGACVATCPSPSCTSGDKRCIGNGNANLVWDKTIGGTNSDEGRGVATDSSGNVYVTGSTASFGAGSYDVWIIKYDSNGNYIWNRTIGGFSVDRGFDIATDSSGNVYVTGSTYSFGAGNNDVWTIKYDSNGNYIWNRTIGGINADYGSGIATDSSGNVYVTGSTYSFGAGSYDIWTIKYDINGNYIWNRTIGGSNSDHGYGIATDPLGFVYVAGHTFSFNVDSDDVWIIKYDSNGNYIWNRTIGGTNGDQGMGVATDSSGNVYVTGHTYSFGAGSYDIWTIKYDINGNYIWNRTIGGINADYGYGITTDYFGNVYVTGQTSSFGAGDYDVWIIKYDSNGNYIWNWTIGGYLANSGKGIATDSSSNIYVTGHTNSFGAGSNDVWTIKLGQSFNTAQTCADYNGDFCVEWGGNVDCALQGKYCLGGVCTASSSSLSSLTPFAHANLPLSSASASSPTPSASASASTSASSVQLIDGIGLPGGNYY